jgi:D-serine deaminase-like pyridoxal phosphate-dependent protein
MAEKARRNKLIFRPHFKTHQSLQISEWFREKGISKITVSSVSMAEDFISGNWKDITIAVPFNIHETDQINNISSDTNLNLLVDSEQTVNYLNKNLKRKLGVFIKIDAGYHRTGIPVDDYKTIDIITGAISSSDFMIFKGFLTHAGETYSKQNKDDILLIAEKYKRDLYILKSHYSTKYPDLIISYGDTPSVSHLEEFGCIDVIRPGNFVFYDYMQLNAGVCSFNQIAVALFCPVISMNKERNELVVYGGAVHLSKEYLIDRSGNKNFGLVCRIKNNLWEHPLEDTYLKSLSQEHGIIKTRSDIFNQFSSGDFIAIIPVHSCLTADLMGMYHTTQGELINHLRNNHLHSV